MFRLPIVNYVSSAPPDVQPRDRVDFTGPVAPTGGCVGGRRITPNYVPISGYPGDRGLVGRREVRIVT